MDCPWGSSDDEASMQIDLDAKQEETTADNSTTIAKTRDTYDPAEPTDDYDPSEPTTDVKVSESKKSNICGGDDEDHDLDYDPADPTLSDDELDTTGNAIVEEELGTSKKAINEDESDTTKNIIGDESKEMSENVTNDKEDVAEVDENECNEKSVNKEEVSSDEYDNDGRWDSQIMSSQNAPDVFNNSSPEYDNSSTPEKGIEGHNGMVEDDESEKDVSGVAAVENVDGGDAAPLDRDENSQMSTLSETNNDNGVGDEGLSDDVPDVTFDDSDFVLEKEPFDDSGEKNDRTAAVKKDADFNGESVSKLQEDDDEENDDGRSKSSHTEGNKWGEEEEDLDEKEREWRRRRQEEVAHLNEEALVDLFREESEPDKEIAEGEMVEQQATKKTKKKVGSKKLKKKGKKVKGQGKKGQLSSKSQDPDHGDQRFVEISRERPSVESREEGELDQEGHGLSRRRSYDDRGGGQHRYDYRHDDRSYRDDADPREPGEIVESEGKKKGVKKKDKKEKKKKKSKREVATIEEGNQGDEDSQKFPSFLAGFFVQDGMEELEEGQESFVNDFDEEDPRSLFAKASGESSFRKRQETSDREETARSFERVAEHESDGHYAEESEHWRNSRRHDERWHESREIRHDSRERRHGSREGRYERDHRLDVSNDRDKERERGRSRSERGRDRGRDREREREREKEAERERERNRRVGERRRGRASRSRSRERRRRSVSRDRTRRSRSRDRSSRRRRNRSRSQDKSAERERDRERERERERSRRRRERSRERESERRVRRVSHSKSRSPRRRSERASSNKENREELQRRRQRQRARSEEEESEEREPGRRYRHQRRRERERSSSPTGSSSDSSSSQSPAHRPQLHHLNFQNYSEDEGNSSDVILVEPERIVINLDDEEDPPSRVDITVGNSGDDGNARSGMARGSRSSALIQINPAADEDTRVVEAANDIEESGDATPTRDEASDKAHETQSSEAVKESDYDPAHPTEEDNEESIAQEKEQTTEQGNKSPLTAAPAVAAAAATASTTSNEVDDAAPPVEKGPVPPDHPPPEEIRPSPPPIPAETESSVQPPLRQQLHPAQQQQQRLGPSPLAGNLLNNPVMRLINPLLLQQQQKQMSLGAQPGGGLLPLPNTPPTRMPFMMNQNRGDSEGGPPSGFPQEQQRHIRPLLQIPDRRPPGFGPGGPDASSLLHHPFGPMGQQQPNTNNMLPNMHPRMPISAMPPLAQLTSLLPALEKAKMAQQQQQDGHLGLGPMFGKHHQPSLLGKPPPLSTNSASNNIPLHNNMPFRPNRPDFSESTEVVDMDMSPGENDCELELPSPNSDSSKEGRTRKRSSRTGGSRNLAAAAAGKGVVQPIAYLKALSKALEKLDPKGQGQSGGGQNAQDKGKSGSSSKKHRNKLDLNDDDVPASAVDLTNKEKYMRKLHLQERVIDEVKLAIKPFYSSKKITKEQYKLILRKAVPKVCHCKGGNINPQKIQELVEAYVKKLGKKQGGGHGGSGKKKSKGASKDGAHNAKEGASGVATGGVKQNGERAKKAVAGR